MQPALERGESTLKKPPLVRGTQYAFTRNIELPTLVHEDANARWPEKKTFYAGDSVCVTRIVHKESHIPGRHTDTLYLLTERPGQSEGTFVLDPDGALTDVLTLEKRGPGGSDSPTYRRRGSTI